MHNSGISIWLFIGILLTIYGALVLGYGLYEIVTGNYPAGVELTRLHAPIWWGAVLLMLGLIYVIKFRPRSTAK